MHTAIRREMTIVSVRHIGFTTRLLGLYRRLFALRARRLSPEMLQGLNDHTLKDIGLTRSQIAASVYCLDREAGQSAGMAIAPDRPQTNEGASRP